MCIGYIWRRYISSPQKYTRVDNYTTSAAACAVSAPPIYILESGKKERKTHGAVVESMFPASIYSPKIVFYASI